MIDKIITGGAKKLDELVELYSNSYKKEIHSQMLP